MERREQVLAARFDPAHGTAEQPRRRGGGELFAVERNLLAEAAADVRRDHAHRALRNSEARRQRRAHRMRDLRRVPERERLVARQPACETPACLDRRVRLPALVKAHVDHAVGGAQGRFDVAVSEHAGVGAIRRNRLIDQREAGIRGVLGSNDGRETLVFDVDERARVLDLVAVLTDHAGDEVADEADLVRRQGRHRHR